MPNVHVEVTTAVTLTTTSETVVASVATTGIPAVPAGAIAVAPVSPPAIISGVINVTPGTATTSLTVRCRSGLNNVAGGLVGAIAGESVAASAVTGQNLPYEFTDPTGQAAGYTITIQQNAATGNGSVAFTEVDISYQ
jgi:hypothetical protein